MSEKRHWVQTHKLKLIGLLVVAILLLLFAATVAAEHEANHRYDVRGYVLNVDERPLNGVPVTILLDDRVIGSARTGGKGYYSIRLHLHDSDIGSTLAVRAGDQQALIRMEAEHGDQTTARVHHVNFVGGEIVDKRLFGKSIPTWAYIAAAPLLIWAAVYLTGVTRRRFRQLKKAHASAKPVQGKQRKAKGRR